MEKEIEPKKMNVQKTPRRMGLSRTVASKRPHQQENPKFQSSSTSQAGNESLSNVKKHRKLSVNKPAGNVPPKEENDSASGTKETTCKQLKMEISQMKLRLVKYEKYRAEKKELTEQIQVWSNGGKAALEMIQEFQPGQKIEEIQKQLGLPEDIFDF